MAGAFRGLWGTPLPEEQSFRPASDRHQGCNCANADGTGTTWTAVWMARSEFFVEDKSWHVCILSVFVLSHAFGSMMNQQCVQPRTAPFVPSFAVDPHGLLISSFSVERIRCKKSTQARWEELMQGGGQCTEEHSPILKVQEKTHEEQGMVVKSQLESSLHSNCLTSAPEGWVSANSRPGSLRDEEMRSHLLCPPILVRRKRFAQSWALCYADCPQLTQSSSPHPDFPFTASSKGKWNAMLLCAF